MNDARRCTATNRQGDRCGRAAIEGGHVCNRHGGGSPKVREAAQRRLQFVEARRQVETLGLPRDVGPAEALLEEVRRTAGHVSWLADRVRSLDPDALVWGVTGATSGRMAQGAVDYIEESAKPSIWWDLYSQERRHLVAVCAAALKAGVQERMVRLAEAQGQMLAEVIRGVLDDPALGLDSTRRAAADAVVHRHLVALSTGA